MLASPVCSALLGLEIVFSRLPWQSSHLSIGTTCRPQSRSSPTDDFLLHVLNQCFHMHVSASYCSAQGYPLLAHVRTRRGDTDDLCRLPGVVERALTMTMHTA